MWPPQPGTTRARSIAPTCSTAPIASAEPSVAAKEKKRLRQTADGLPGHSFSTLLAELGTRCRNTCRTNTDGSGPSFQLLTKLTPLQARAFQLLGL